MAKNNVTTTYDMFYCEAKTNFTDVNKQWASDLQRGEVSKGRGSQRGKLVVG